MIPQWLQDEVSEYKINLTHAPRTILDIGANIGAFSLWALAQWPEARITAYEPVADNARDYERNCRGLWVNGRTELKVAAVRATGGRQWMKKGTTHSTGSFHDLGRQGADSAEVECLAASSLPAADLVKIDTEGCEVEIVMGYDFTATQAVLCEYHRAEDARVIHDRLVALGFELVRQSEYAANTGLLKMARPGAWVRPPKPNIFIAIPAYGGTPLEFTQSLLKLQADPPCDYSLIFMPGDSLVSRARNSLTAEFLKSECTHLLFIDSDLVFSSEQIRRLVAHDEDLVAGFYPKKKDGALEWVCNAYVNAPLPCGLQSVRYMGTGFMLIKRTVFEQMIAAHGAEMGYISDATKRPEFDFWSVGPVKTNREPEDHFVYEPERLAAAMALGLSESAAKQVLRRRYLSEDWYFCQRWLDLGGMVWGDTRVILKHIGTATYPLQSQMGAMTIQPTKS